MRFPPTLCGIGGIEYEQEYDVVFSNSVLHWVTEIEDAVRRFYRALKQDGIIRLQFPLLNAGHPMVRYAMRAGRELGFTEHFIREPFPWYVPDSKDEFLKVLAEAGFRDELVSLESNVFTFPSADAVYQHFASVGLDQFSAALDEKNKADFLVQVQQDLLSDFPNRAELLYERIFAYAVR